MKKLFLVLLTSAMLLSGCSGGSKDTGKNDDGTVTITIDANGKNFKDGAVTEIKNYDISEPLTIHEEHYFTSEDVEKFKGWTIDDDETVISGQKIPVEKSIILHAVWEE